MQPHPMIPDIRWIAPAQRKLSDPMPIETCYFKALLALPKVPATCEIIVSANSRFRLYVNGAAVMDGPCKGDEWRHYCDRLDIGPWLREGMNVVAAQVVAYPAFGAVTADMANAGPHSVIGNAYGPMLYLEADAVELSTGRADWRCRLDDAVSHTAEAHPLLAGGNEVVEGALLPHGWEAALEFSDEFIPAVPRWDNCPFCGEISPLPLFERPIPLSVRLPLPVPSPLENCHQDAGFPSEPGAALTIAAGRRCELTLDVGKLTTAFLELAMSGGRGASVRVGYAEAFGERAEAPWIKKGRRDDSGKEFLGIWDEYRPGGERHQDGAPEAFRPFWFRTFRFLRIVVETAEEALTLYPPALTETRYPLEDSLRFRLPGLPWMRPVYDISLRTLQLCMHETYEDCPFYEQLQYVMDTRLQILFTYAVSGDTRMARRTLDDFHRSLAPEGISQARYPGNYRQVIPLFSLHWILILLDYYEQTGDLAALEDYRPTVERILRWFRRKTGSTGMVERLGHWEFVDWTTEWNPAGGVPDAVKLGPSAVNNFFYAYVLGRSAELFRALELPDLAARYEREGAAISGVTSRLCWDNGRQLFREGPECSQFSQHTQVYAVLCGAVEGEAARRVMERTLADKSLVQCSFVMQFYLFRALEAAGLYAETEGLWPAWQALPELNLSTVPEVPGPMTRSDCHAWGALALFELPRRFFGVTALEPGYRTIQIAPCAPFAGDFDAEVPTPGGMVMLAGCWRNGRLALRGFSPAPCRVILPDGGRYEFPAGDFQAGE